MGLVYAPKNGTILICAYDSGMAPEMEKPRPVVLLASVSAGLGIVVPLSTTAPKPQKPWHYLLTFNEPISDHFSKMQAWAKCDMIASVSFGRLNLPQIGKRHGRRVYKEMRVNDADLAAIRTAVWQAISS